MLVQNLTHNRPHNLTSCNTEKTHTLYCTPVTPTTHCSGQSGQYLSLGKSNSSLVPALLNAAAACIPPRGITTYEVHLARPWWTKPLLFGKNVHVTCSPPLSPPPGCTLLPCLSKNLPPLIICGNPLTTRPTADSGVRYSTEVVRPCGGNRTGGGGGGGMARLASPFWSFLRNQPEGKT